MLKNTSKTEENIEEHTESEVKKPHRPLLWSAMTAICVVVFVYISALFIGGTILGAYAGIRHWSSAYTDQWLSSSVVAQFLYILLDETITVALLWGFMKWRRYRGVRKALGLVSPKAKDFYYVLSGAAVYFIVYIFAVNIAAKFIHIDVNQQQDVGFQVVNSHRDLILTFFSLVVLPPIVEEIVFRGFLFGGLRRRFPLWAAMLVTSAIFAIPHLLESNGTGLLWTAGIDTFILSLVLCYVREKTGHLYAGMVIHGLKNFLAFYVLFMNR
jgi:membrane protease YdiL (CAAX protease family)